jgi:hypothetical protein
LWLLFGGQLPARAQHIAAARPPHAHDERVFAHQPVGESANARIVRARVLGACVSECGCECECTGELEVEVAEAVGVVVKERGKRN